MPQIISGWAENAHSQCQEQGLITEPRTLPESQHHKVQPAEAWASLSQLLGPGCGREQDGSGCQRLYGGSLNSLDLFTIMVQCLSVKKTPVGLLREKERGQGGPERDTSSFLVPFKAAWTFYSV